MRRHTLFAAAALLALSAPAHAAPPALNLQALHLDGVIRDVVLPVALPLVGNLVADLASLHALDALHGLNGLVPGLLSGAALPLAGALTQNGLPALPALDGLGGVVNVVVSDVALPAVGQVVLIIR
ncbi:hypothetical protein DFR24_0641 [Panacagrimonas perspica]|uniref:GLTT repeat-containing protein n=1 Tax=Panacagrimonas perspica TaxID=381431 RepID=A0A4R7PBA9_9GAMM|nr:hypothetical protein [Panacagrimonas perspica]TDU31277.1 hypothetical protein DFR24_0641 [Panacagrimonas perspica]